MGRMRTFLGLVLIVIGTILLSRALMQPPLPPMAAVPPRPDMPEMPELPDMPPLPAMPEMPKLPDMPELPPIPPVPPVPAVAHAPSFHWGAWFSPPVLIVLVLLAALWLRRRGTHERPLA